MSFYAIRENKILAKISESTVFLFIDTLGIKGESRILEHILVQRSKLFWIYSQPKELVKV